MIRNPKDFWTGLIYIFFGSSAIVIAREYGMGTAIKMGPAYFPTVLDCIRFCRARRGIGGRPTVARHHRRFGELTVSLAFNVDNGGGSYDLLHSGVSRGPGYSAADNRSLVRRLNENNGQRGR
jgi:hypothetical protein